MIIRLVISESPISVNHMYGQSRNGRRFLSKKGKDYKETVKNIAIETGCDHLLDDELEVRVSYYFGDKRRRDVTNYDKALLDAMSGVVYNDDCQIQRIILEKYYDKESPRTEVTILTRS